MECGDVEAAEVATGQMAARRLSKIRRTEEEKKRESVIMTSRSSLYFLNKEVDVAAICCQGKSNKTDWDGAVWELNRRVG